MKTLTIFLTTAPYAFENTHTALRLTRAALEKGYTVNLFASADGVYNFTQGHQAKGVPDAEKEFAALIQGGLHVELCGSCLGIRGIDADTALPGTAPSSMKRLFGMVKSSDIFITLGS